MAKDWRGFASDFAGPGEIRFEDFEGHKGAPGIGDGKGLLGAGLIKTWDGQFVMDESTRQEKVQAMKRKLRDHQQRQQKVEERRKQKELQMAEEWQKHAVEIREQKLVERKERLQALQESQQRAIEAKALREAAERAEAEHDKNTISVFLTDVASGKHDSLADGVSNQDKSIMPVALGKPLEEKTEKKLRKPGLPPEAKVVRKEHQAGVVDKQRDKSSVIQQLPQLFPGLRRTAEGKQILENAEPTQSFEKGVPVTQEHHLRKAQIKLMDQLAAQVSEYRKSMKSKIFSPVSPSLGLNDSDRSPALSRRSIGPSALSMLEDE